MSEVLDKCQRTVCYPSMPADLEAHSYLQDNGSDLNRQHVLDRQLHTLSTNITLTRSITQGAEIGIHLKRET
jgi:hypothetical protein